MSELIPMDISKPNAHQHVVMVVDDNPVNLMVAQLQLQKCWPQAQITTADSGPKALALIEAQAAGVPALVSNVEGCRDVVQDGVTGFAFGRL
mgnify:CR=1 FL=1